MTEGCCLVCGANSLSRLEGYTNLPRVTSDCKPWPAGGELAVCETCGAVQKIPSVKWFEEIGRIYDGYQIYQLSDGAEQVIFSADGQAVARSQTLVNHAAGFVDTTRPGRLIDIGCGNGAAIANFSKVLPGWSLSGSELSDAALERMKRIPGFETLYTVGPEHIPGAFDVVTLIHSLEHMPDPAKTLADSVALMASGGILLIEIPDVETSPFDILIADHLSHYSRDTLGHLAGRCGLALRELTNSFLPKEITLIGVKGGHGTPIPNPQKGRHIVETNLAWLQSLLALFEDACSAGPCGIFGSSISAMWLYGALDHRVEFFIDEDVSRIGKEVDGRPILAPADAPAGTSVLVPLAPHVAANVQRRLQSLPVRFVFPTQAAAEP